MRVEPTAQHDGPPGGECREHEDVVPDVVDHREEGGQDDPPFEGDAAGEGERESVRREGRARVREHDALGHGGRSRGGQDLEDVVPVNPCLGLGGRLVVDEGAEADAAGYRAATDLDRHVGADAGSFEAPRQARPDLGVDDRQARLGEPDEVRDDVRGVGGVHGEGDGADLGGPEPEGVCLDGVLAREEDPVAAVHSTCEQTVRDLVGELVELAVGESGEPFLGPGACPADDRRHLGHAPGEALDEVGHAHPVPAMVCSPIEQRCHVEVHLAPSDLRCMWRSSRIVIHESLDKRLP